MNFHRQRTRSRRNSLNTMMNTEKWRSFPKRVSRMDSNFAEESESTDSEETKVIDIKDWSQEFFSRNNESNEQIDQDVEVRLSTKQTLLLATMVPDEVLLLESFDEKMEPKRFVGVLLMADVSGYTALSERYANTGKGGTYRLTVTLNTYLGSLIEVIYTHGGDILKFAGDAFLALWKTDKRTFLNHTIHTAIACALVIQHSFGSYETDVKVNLKVKLAISAGNLIFSTIGKGIDMNYIIIGLPVLEAKTAESLCLSGEVRLTPTAWGHCYSRNYDYIIHDDGHVTIRSILYDPREKDVTKPFLGFGTLVRQVKKPFVGVENLPETILEVCKTKSVMESGKANDALNLRKTILTAEERNIGSEIRKFMIRPVLTQIDAHQPLEYLTEMRDVSVLFVTLKPCECPFPQLITIVNNSYQITCEIVYKSMGCVNKIILFDKDVMILVIFGLRGFKHESEAQAALKCSSGIKKSLSALDGVLEVSIGVTTGQVYCGVVGHPLRREFTVIGAVVNKAARFMCYFRNKITCDETTFVKSKMSSNGFTLQPAAELKGINDPGKVYEYTEEIRVKELYDIPVTPPLLDRLDEFEYFKNWIDENHVSHRDFDAILLIGEHCSGKSRLIEALCRYVRNNGMHTCYLNLSSIHSATPYLALGQIVNQMLGLREPIKGFEKEEKIVKLLKSCSPDLCYLNNIIKVRFAYHEGIYSQDEPTRKEKAKNMFINLLKAFNPCVIFIDDIQNLDASSWDYISLMLNIPQIYNVLTLTRGKFNSVQSWLYNVFINSAIRKIVLGSLHSAWIPPLACQILDVEAVPKDLCETLKSKCRGLPGLVESFIVHMFSNGALEIKKIPKYELESYQCHDLQFPDRSFLQLQAVNKEDQETLDQLIYDNYSDDISICIVTKKEVLDTDINEQNLDAIIMVQIDSLTPYQQLLLKIASVIGNILSRNLLENIMYENNPLTTAKAIKRLFSMRILTCANVRYRSSRRTTNMTSATSFNNATLTCDCSFEYDPEENENLPKYAFCKVMKFRNKNSRKTCYELLPINQKKEFHSRIVNYLEKNKQKCPDCGGVIMIIQSITNVSIIDSECDVNTSLSNIVEYTKNNVLDPPQENDEEVDILNKESIDVRRTYSLKDISELKTISTENASHSGSFQGDKKNSQPLAILKSKSERPNSLNVIRRPTKRVTMPNLLNKDIVYGELEILKIFDMLRPVTEAKAISDWHRLGIIDSRDDINDSGHRFFKLNIEKGVSKTRFDKCSCLELNITIYEQLIHHAKEANLKVKVIEFLINYSYFNLLANNFDTIYPKLDEAQEICSEKNIEFLSVFNKRRYVGRIYSIRAATLLMGGKLGAAKIQINEAAKIYSFNLDKVLDFFSIHNIITGTSFKPKRYKEHKIAMKSESIFFLNVASLLYSALGDEKTCRIATSRALHLTQKVECNVVDICDAFSNAIQVELARGYPEHTEDIELMAMNTFKNLTHPIRADELFAVGKFFMASFRARMTRGKLPEAVRSGFRSLGISRFLHADKISLEIIPDLFYILLSRRRIEEAVDVLKLLLQILRKQCTTEWETWYYALCIDLVLDAGFQLESPSDISQYAEHSLHKGVTAGPSRRRLITGLWVYWLRTDVDRKAKYFESEALYWIGNEDEDVSFNTVFSSMRLAEGMLESLARKMDDLRKIVDLMELRSIAERELSRLEKDTRLMRAAYPRWLLLKANSLLLSGRQNSALSTFNHALEEARRIHSHLEEALVRASISNSRIWVQNARTENFLQWREGCESARISWHRIMYGVNSTRI